MKKACVMKAGGIKEKNEKEKKSRVELVLPAGDAECLRAAVSNGADAVYFGLRGNDGAGKFNARRGAGNFTPEEAFSAIRHCHEHKVRAFVAMNTLVKNSETEEYFGLMGAACRAGADAVIIQDPCFIPIIKENFPGLRIHLSTQATVTNSYSVPEGVDRVIPARELSLGEIRKVSERLSKRASGSCETEVFVHGALCFSYSGQCLFSSMVGGRSGNRGLCAQPCRKQYNNKYLLSTMDLCTLEKIPELIGAGVSALKVEGRLRSPLYVATAARVYRKYIDLYCNDHQNHDHKKAFPAGSVSGPNFSACIDPKDIEDLMLAFNREFTQGFAFTDSVTDPAKPMNRGLYLGQLVLNEAEEGMKSRESGKEGTGTIILKHGLRAGDGVGLWVGGMNGEVVGQRIGAIMKEGAVVREAFAGDSVELKLGASGLKAGDGGDGKRGVPLYKTSSAEAKAFLGDEINPVKQATTAALTDAAAAKKIVLPETESRDNKDKPKLFVKVYSVKSAMDADNSGADVVYYDALKDDCSEAKSMMRRARFFLFTPRILSDAQAENLAKRIDEVRPDGVLVANRGLLNLLTKKKSEYELHLDSSFNCFNDADVDYYHRNYGAIPILSLELNFSEASAMKDKNFIIPVHGSIVLMTTKQKLKAPELVDEEGRHFAVRPAGAEKELCEILNCIPLGLFNKVRDYLGAGIKYFYLDLSGDVSKFIGIYRRIIAGEPFDDSKIRRGYTKGHFDRGVR